MSALSIALAASAAVPALGTSGSPIVTNAGGIQFQNIILEDATVQRPDVSDFKFALPILVIAFLLHLAIEWWKFHNGAAPDWKTPILRTIIFSVLLLFYYQISGQLVRAVSALGGSADGTATTLLETREGFLAKQAERFEEYTKRYEGAERAAAPPPSDDDTVIGSLTGSVKNLAAIDFDRLARGAFGVFMHGLTWATFTFAAGVAWFIKVLQKVTLSTILSIGPVMIALAALPGVTSRFLSSWFMALLEVSSWGIVVRIITRLLMSSSESTMGDALENDAFGEYVVINIIYAGSFLAVPFIVSAIFRGAVAQVLTPAAAVGAVAGAGTAALGALIPSRGRGRSGSQGGGGEGKEGGSQKSSGGGGSASSERAGDDAAATSAAKARRRHFGRLGAQRRRDHETPPRSDDS